MALGPFKFLFRDSKWPVSCKKTHDFAEKYVNKALNHRRQILSNHNDLALELGDKQQRHVLLYAMAEQTEDRIELRNQILQALMAAQETTAVLISNTFFLLSRHPLVWQQLRKEVLALADTALDTDVLQKMGYLRNVLHEGNISTAYSPSHPKLLTHLTYANSPPLIPRLSPNEPRRAFRHHAPSRRWPQRHLPNPHTRRNGF